MEEFPEWIFNSLRRVIYMKTSIDIFTYNPLIPIWVMGKMIFYNSEADASELLENLEEMFTQYYMYCGVH